METIVVHSVSGQHGVDSMDSVDAIFNHYLKHGQLPTEASERALLHLQTLLTTELNVREATAIASGLVKKSA